MPKYSTGGAAGGGGGDACELCGAETDDLAPANVAGAQLLVCRACRPHDDAAHKREKKAERSPQRETPDRRKELAQRIARARDAVKPDTTRWEREGAGYDDDPLPYLVAGYGERVTEARQAEGLTLDELAEALEVPEDDLLAIEQGRAARAGVGGGVVEALEEALQVELAEE
ncbi:MAG: multiprotein-bridging factor 1 family protein [Halobacteriales archaeon]